MTRTYDASAQAVRRFTGSPSQLAAAYPEVAQRTSFTMTHGELRTIYRYHVHMDRTAMYAFVNRASNMTRPVVRDA